MDLFTKLFGDFLIFVYHCFDRIVIHGYLTAAILKEGRDDFFAGGFPNQRKHDSRWGWRSWRRFCLA